MKHALANDHGTGREAGAGTCARLAPGWYGKLPTLGDFAARRMAPDFQQAWDGWLAAGLADWSANDPDGWLDAYLAAPSWRFLMMGGGADPSPHPDALSTGSVMAGVLMPSVDRVGRYFPFTLVRPLPRIPEGANEAADLLAWLHRADDLAVDALHDNWSIDTLESALATLAAQAPVWFDAAVARPSALASRTPSGTPSGTRAAASAIGTALGQGVRECSPCADLAALLSGQAPAARGAGGGVPSGEVWWFCGDAQGALHLRITLGLPVGTDFAEVFGRPVGGGAAAAADASTPPSFNWDALP